MVTWHSSSRIGTWLVQTETGSPGTAFKSEEETVRRVYIGPGQWYAGWDRF